MIHLVTGGSASGKSSYAEGLAMEAALFRYYIATMDPFGEEGQERVRRHRAMREGKGFQTIECRHHLSNVIIPKRHSSVVLLECVMNLTANEQFAVGGSDTEIVSRILEGVEGLACQAGHVVIVTGEVFSDGSDYPGETKRYLSLLGRVNQELAVMADVVTEVVYGIPVHLKRRICGLERQG